MDDKLAQWLSLLGVIIFVGSAIMFSSRVNEQRKLKLQQEFESKFSMFKVFFNHSNVIIKELGIPILKLKRSKGKRFILSAFLCFIFLVIALFYRGVLNTKLIMLAIIGVWFIWSVVNATNYVTVYKNAFEHGNIINKKVVWFNDIDSIEARLYDYNGIMDTRQAEVYRVYDVKRNGKVIFDIWETEFSSVRMIERCFDFENPFVAKIQESFDSNILSSEEDL